MRLLAFVLMAITAAGAILGLRGAQEAQRLSSTAPRSPQLLRVRDFDPKPARPYLNVGVASVNPESREVLLRVSFPYSNELDGEGDVGSVTSWPPGAAPGQSFALGGGHASLRESEFNAAGQEASRAGRSRVKEFTLPAWGGPFMFPFDSYTLRFTVAFSTIAGKSYDSATVPMKWGLGPGFAGLSRQDSIVGFQPEWAGTIVRPQKAGDHEYAIYSVTLSRPLMPRVMFVVFFVLTVLALIAAVAAARDRRDLVAVAAGTIGTAWAVRSIVLAGNAFTTPTLPDVTAYFIVLLAVALILVKLHRLMAHEAPREVD